MRWLFAALIGALCLARGTSAQPPPAGATPPRAPPPRATPPPKDAVPDLEFLEYLGSWQGDDDEWLAIKEWDQDGVGKGAANEHKDRAPDPARNVGHDKNE